MRIPALLLTTALTAAVHAQWPSLPADSAVDLTTRWRHWVQVEGSVDVNSNAIDNGMAMGLWQGGFLERGLRTRNSERMGTHNTAGYLMQGRIGWTGAPGLFGKENWRPVVSVGHREVMGVRFTRDLFDLTFFGNAPYAERTMNAGPSAHTRINYQTVGVGVRHARSTSFIRLDVVKGQSFSTSDIRRGQLLTATDGRQIDLLIQGELWQSDTAGSGLDRMNGIGAALSGTWAGACTLDEKPVEWRAGVQDLGFVQWNSRTMHLAKDTSLTYEGFHVTNVLALDGVFLDQDRLMDTLGLHQRPGTHTALLPFHATLAADMRCGTGWNVGIAADHVYLPGYRTQFTLSGARTIGTRAQVGLGAVYGGFGGFRVSAAARIRLGERAMVSIATPGLPGFLGGGTMGWGALVGVSVGW